MSMFCYQCQETCKNTGCTMAGVCGKKADTANMMDLLMHTLKGIALVVEASGQPVEKPVGQFLTQAMFATITNANFDTDRITDLILQAQKLRDDLKAKYAGKLPLKPHDSVVWSGRAPAEMQAKNEKVGVLSTENEDVRSLRELLVYGLKGISAYADHAAALDKEDDRIYQFLVKGLASTTKNLPVEEMVALVMEAGSTAALTMATLDAANTGAYGNPEITKVKTGVRGNPGILISGHDLRDLEDLLKQTAGTGVDVYTHSEMLPANYYPKFKTYGQLAGNYGSSWWRQNEDFASFNGPVLMTTNCIIPVKDSYKDRMFTTGMAGYPGVKHIPDRQPGKMKDFSAIIELARSCRPPVELENGEIVGGFAHDQALALADKIVAAVKSGAIKRFIVMAGCDGRQKTRSYFTEVAEKLPNDAVILTAGCAKYRYNKLNLGDIGGIPRVLDAGQCNDSYSLAVIALKLKEVFGLNDINQLPISFDLAWYEQKAVAVLLALLHLGIKGIRLGPTLPAFLSPNVANVLVEKFDIKLIAAADSDVAAMMAGK